MTHRPQAREMADESMVRNLAAQVEAIWPQEEAFFRRYALPSGARVLDVGCGTGEIEPRLAAVFPDASFLGIDVVLAHLERARARCAAFGPRMRFELGDALALAQESDQFDLVVCRHVVQAIPDAPRAVAEMARVARPGGRLHVIAEDYGMLWCHPTAHDADEFWQRVPQLFGRAIGVDNHIGRKMFGILTGLGLADITVDYVVVDTVRVPRDTFARIWEAWRDGYTDTLAEHTGIPRAELAMRWREMIECVRDPQGYALWQVPVWSARKP
jgi:ubiquinone/menaquinone biosynthesis C-methylase UbiE